ncbi:Ger(x)C family spore germination protein [Desulfitobacterium metallireducens]|uniref:Germination protein, Ger(X)C family n=1 Tax=Desulfitobacterium metallireducens DSM 15288 TaxID=871968 RepID=W0E4N3_9FIRM|nr:Ger(x)C family spore germination protein [Desulfitobacterium metallireducens]AHF05687.1 germination protein, Ger(x)C family [Desulfitobacterium metallireducens DSM 15288]
MEAKKTKTIFKRVLIFLLIFSVFFLEGCWGKREVEQLAFVIGLGIDQGEKPGDIILTYQMAQPKKGGQSGAEINNWTLTTEVTHAPLSEDKLYEILDRHPFLGTTKVLIIGEELAKSGIGSMIDSFQRFYQFRRTMYLLVAKGKAKDILNTKLRNDQLPSLSLAGRIDESKGVSTYPVIRIGHYLTLLSREGQTPIVPIVDRLQPGEGGIDYKGSEGGEAEELQIEGAGVFRGDKIISYLSDQETKGFMWLENLIGIRFIGTEEINGISLTAKVTSSKAKYSVTQDEKGLRFSYQLKAKATIDDIKGSQPPMSVEEWGTFSRDAEKAVAQAIEKECRSAISKDKEIPNDFLGIGRHIEQKNPSLWKEVRNHWENTLQELPVDIEVEVVIENSGVGRNSPVSPKETRQE